MLGNRSINQVLNAIVGRQHYIALFNMLRNYPSFFDSIYRYLTARGNYPYDISIRTPTGPVAARLYSHHDLLTVNEIFCRLDYPAHNDIKVVVDVGSNIGISALFFLSRNSISKCYLFEPDPRNIEKLKRNLLNFENRYILYDKAISPQKGSFEFGIEPTGRYGGIGVKGEKTIIVDCLEINEVIESVLSLSLSREAAIDILKIDTEGLELETVQAIRVDLLRRIKRIYMEACPRHHLHPAIFKQRQYGSVCQLFNKNAC